MPTLLDPIRMGAFDCPNRILMAPLTRGRATADHVPTPLMVEYYRQRASAGLIISEATGISRQGLGWPYAPGIWNEAQVEGWRAVTAAVHEAGGRIVLQLWHMGRVVHPDFLDGQRPVSASDVAAPGYAHTYAGKQPHVAPRPLRPDEIPGVIADYVRAAENAMAAGFDGVQIHGANGYLIDQFLRDSANKRDDDYGGPPENRIRLLREVTEAVTSAVGAERTSVRLSPTGEVQGVRDSNPEPLFIAAAEALDRIGIAFLELREPKPNGTFAASDEQPLSPVIRRHFRRPLVLNSDYDAETGAAAVASGQADAVAFGRWFISNPDLVERIAAGIPLAPYDMSTFYTRGPEGYIDYPRHSDRRAA